MIMERPKIFTLAKVFDDEVDNTGWCNNADELFKERSSEQTFNYLRDSQFKEATRANGTIMGGLGVKLKRSFTSITTVPTNGISVRPPRAVGGAGFCTVVKKLRIPPNDFWQPGMCWRMRLRHANFSLEDDAALDGKVACLKFSDDDQGGPLDLILHTGRASQYYNSTSFEQFIQASKGGSATMKEWVYKQPSNYFGRVENVRRAPDSYYDQRYYSHLVYEYISTDGVQRLAKIRMLPADGCEETGLPSRQDQEKIWNTERSRDENRSTDYLLVEYLNRLAANPLQYRLQIQLRKYTDNDLQELLNPSLIWDSDLYPWTDLAMLTIALQLEEEIIAKTKLHLSNHPQCFRLHESKSAEDFSSLAYVVDGLHGSLDKSYRNSEEEEILCDYVVTVVTGNVGHAGTDADIYITITGTHGRTKPINLDNAMHDDFEPGQEDVFTIQASPVGDVIAIQMELRSILPSRAWFLNYVIVKDVIRDKTVKCPCYQWITTAYNTVLLRRVEALLANQEMSPYSFLHRKFELEEKRKSYQWEKVADLPSQIKVSSYDDLPRVAKFHAEKEHDLRNKYLRTLGNTGYSKITNMFDKWGDADDYIKMLSSLLQEKKTVKKVAQHWKEDVEFGRQFLNGVNPIRIRKVNPITKIVNMHVTDAMLEGILDRGLKYKEECAANHMYYVTYPELESLCEKVNRDPKNKRFLVAPICLFYVKKNGDFVPVAIQLRQRPGAENPIWTPNDSEHEWLFAKMWVRLADAQIHEIKARHLGLQSVMEVVAIATLRNLPSVHPVYKVIVPHLRYTIAVNVLARESLADLNCLYDKFLAVGNCYSKVLKEAYERFNFSQLNVPQDLEDRGVENKHDLPRYYYRDDALELWRILKKFVRTMLMLHYWTPENVQRDEELQAWVRDIHYNGFPSSMAADMGKGVPETFSTLDEVIDFITCIVFTATGRHAALTLPMMDYLAFPPNVPTMLGAPPPTKKGQVQADLVMKALPNKNKTAEIISCCYVLSRSSRDDIFLGDYPTDHFDNDVTLSAIEALKEELKQLSETITARNEGLAFPYNYLLPERITISISS